MALIVQNTAALLKLPIPSARIRNVADALRAINSCHSRSRFCNVWWNKSIDWSARELMADPDLRD
jgi:hypothetical protein